MLGIDARVLRATWTLFLFALILIIIYEIGHTLVLFALAVFLAQLLSPLVDLVERFAPRRLKRGISLGIVYIFLLAVLVAIMIPIGSKIGEQASILASKLPDIVTGDALRFPLPSWLEPQRPTVEKFIRERVQQLGNDILPNVSRAGRQILTGLGSILSLILIPILSFLMLKDGDHMRAAITGLFGESARPAVQGILADLHFLLAHYMRALILLAMATFGSFSIYLWAAGAPYPVLLASIAGALEAIPVIGPLMAAIIVLVVSGLSGYSHIIGLIVFLGLYRLFQDYVLSPYLMSAGVAIPPLLVLFGVLAGEQLAGIPGMFFSVPVIAALRMVLTRLRARHEA